MSENEKATARVYREQLITIENLNVFKTDLIKEIELLLKRNGNQPHKKWLKSFEVRKILDISTGTLQALRINGTAHNTGINPNTVFLNNIVS